MSFLVDTNVVSESTRPKPNPAVLDWIAAQPEESLFISAITVGELCRGALLLPAGKKRNALLDWIENGIKADFTDRILPVDTAVMERWAHQQAAAEKSGRRLPVMDGLLAATALQHNLILATRNVADFEGTGIQLVNPWEFAEG